MTDTDLLQSSQNPAPQGPAMQKPASLPDKFWDARTGAVRTDALVSSYLALERKLSGLNAPRSEEERAKFHRLLGVPETPDGYCVTCDHGLFTPDPEINGKLHAAAFTPDQVQLVYDMAAEKLVPLILDIAGEFQADREVERLVEQFGGKDRWREVSRQILAYGRRALPEDVLSGLSASYEGVMALWRMMQAEQGASAPHNIPESGDVPGGEKDLRKMMRDPKYWRDRDPAFVAKVTQGFRNLYGE
ncbi:MAG: hypothetical protein H6862_07470 [Rhodospirillales bacterium]|nr:hypothetical protein [Rhodospirillales bacterium]